MRGEDNMEGGAELGRRQQQRQGGESEEKGILRQCPLKEADFKALFSKGFVLPKDLDCKRNCWKSTRRVMLNQMKGPFGPGFGFSEPG